MKVVPLDKNKTMLNRGASSLHSSSSCCSDIVMRAKIGWLALLLLALFLGTQTVLHTLLEAMDDESLADLPSSRMIIERHLPLRYSKSAPLTNRELYEQQYPPNDANRIRSTVKRLQVAYPATHFTTNTSNPTNEVP